MADHYNELDQVPLADLKPEELQSLKQFEEQLGSKYYLIAFERQ